MSRKRRSRGGSGVGGRVPRTARLNNLLQEIIAEELALIEDERLGMLTVVAVSVDGDLGRALVWYTELSGDEAADDVRAALEQHRVRLQRAIASQARLRRTPELVFEPDQVTREAERVEDILREINAASDEE